MAAKKTPVRQTTRREAAPTRRVRAEPPAAKTGGMTVQEAGRKGGLIGGRKGGETVKAERGIEFYQEIGRKGGQRVRQLIEAGRAAMQPATRPRKGR
jgi:general stress protein YciG